MRCASVGPQKQTVCFLFLFGGWGEKPVLGCLGVLGTCVGIGDDDVSLALRLRLISRTFAFLPKCEVIDLEWSHSEDG